MHRCFLLALIDHHLESDGTMTIVISVAVPAAMLLLIVLVIIIICVRKRRRQSKLEEILLQDMQNQNESLNDEIPRWLMTWPSYDKFQFSKDRLTIKEELGEGHFGIIYFAWATGIVDDEEKTRVAVKTMKRGSSQETAEDFRKKMEIEMEFDHPNVVRLLGICTRDEPLYLIVELTKHGDLKEYIRNAQPNETHPRPLLSIAQLVDIAAQAASGVAYLASRRFVHRDIAARNFFVGENGNKLTIKISDYGMARDVYKDEYCRRKGAAMPIRWMAPEAIADEKQTVESDVWSLGVVLWEIFALGSLPYFRRNNEEVIDGILRGGLSLNRPSLCPRSVYQFMIRCWERNPSERIKSDDVASALKAMSDMGDISARHLAVSPTLSKPPAHLGYTPIRPVNPTGTKFYQGLLSYLDLCDDDVPSASTGHRRSTHLPDSPTESGETTTYEDPVPDTYLDLRDADIPSASTGHKRSTRLPDSQTESEESTTYEDPVPDAYLELPDDDVPSAPTGQRRSTHLPDSQTESEESTTYEDPVPDAYLELPDDDVPSASTGQRRSTHLPDSQSKSEESRSKLDPTYEEPAPRTYLELRDDGVPSASTGQKRSMHLADSQNESEESKSKLVSAEPDLVVPHTYVELRDDDDEVGSASKKRSKHSADDTNALTPTQSELPDCTSMSPVTSFKLNQTLKEKARLLESDDAYVDVSDSSAPSGLKRNTHGNVLQKERDEVEEKQRPKLVKSASVKYENPTYC